MGLLELVLVLLALSGMSGGGSAGTTKYGWRVGPDCRSIALVNPQAWADASATTTLRLVLAEGVTDARVLLHRLLGEFLPECQPLADSWVTANPQALPVLQALIDTLRATPPDLAERTAVYVEADPNALGGVQQWRGPYALLRATLISAGMGSLVAKGDLLGVGGRVIEGTRSIERLT